MKNNSHTHLFNHNKNKREKINAERENILSDNAS